MVIAECDQPDPLSQIRYNHLTTANGCRSFVRVFYHPSDVGFGVSGLMGNVYFRPETAVSKPQRPQ
jgi:hypothetical protein